MKSTLPATTRAETLHVVCGECRQMHPGGILREQGWSLWIECPGCGTRYHGSRAVLPYLAYVSEVLAGRPEPEAVLTALERLDAMPERTP